MVHPKPLTEPKGFHLQTEERGELYNEKFAEKLDQQEKENTHMFRANPVPVDALGHPFIPARSEKMLTVPEDVLLHTDIRAEERKIFEEEIKLREKEMEVLKEVQKREKEV